MEQRNTLAKQRKKGKVRKEDTLCEQLYRIFSYMRYHKYYRGKSVKVWFSNVVKIP